MLAARDQENLAHGHQAAAAAKPLNQGVKQLAPKTPGNKTAKTPLKLPLNDENGATAFGGGKKTVGKANENSIFGAKKGGMMENKGFVTPMGTSCRLAISISTSNVDFSDQDLAIVRHSVRRPQMPKPKPSRHQPLLRMKMTWVRRFAKVCLLESQSPRRPTPSPPS